MFQGYTYCRDVGPYKVFQRKVGNITLERITQGESSNFAIRINWTILLPDYSAVTLGDMARSEEDAEAKAIIMAARAAKILNLHLEGGTDAA